MAGGIFTDYVFTWVTTSPVGGVAAGQRPSPSHYRHVYVCVGRENQRRLQPANERMEPDHTQRESFGRSDVHLPDQYESIEHSRV